MKKAPPEPMRAYPATPHSPCEAGASSYARRAFFIPALPVLHSWASAQLLHNSNTAVSLMKKPLRGYEEMPNGIMKNSLREYEEGSSEAYEE